MSLHFLGLDRPCRPTGSLEGQSDTVAVTSAAQVPVGFSLPFSLTLVCLFPRDDNAAL